MFRMVFEQDGDFFGGRLVARIPDEVIERLKVEVSLERLAEARGVVLRRHGADLVGLCPFHEDREPLKPPGFRAVRVSGFRR